MLVSLRIKCLLFRGLLTGIIYLQAGILNMIAVHLMQAGRSYMQAQRHSVGLTAALHRRDFHPMTSACGISHTSAPPSRAFASGSLLLALFL